MPHNHRYRISIIFVTAPLILSSVAHAQTEDPLSHRKRDKKDRAITDFGGTRETEQAVADGLAWLAAHQRPDGRWDRDGFRQQCPAGDKCSQEAISFESREADVGLSALASLAFLGAGHTHKDGIHAATLSRAFSYILAQQSARGSFAEGSGYQMYCDAICTLAVAECYALTKDEVLRKPLERALAHLARAQQPEGGWDYTSAQTHRNDSSITGWCVMAVKAAQAAGIDTPLDMRLRLIRHFDRATEPDGRVWYSDQRETKFDDDGRPVARSGGGRRAMVKRRYGPAMTATGLLVRSVLGFRMDDPIAKRQIERLLREPPDLDKFRDSRSNGLHSAYYWYYGTLASFHIGGDAWAEWNPALRQAILEYQERPTTPKGKHKHSFGSWPAFGRGWGKWGRTGGRVYSTAINTLTLEIYYRYVPAYLSPQSIIGPHEIRELIDRAGPEEQRDLVALAARFHADIAEPILLDLFESATSEDVRLEAAIELANIGSPAAMSQLVDAEKTAKPATSHRIRAALAKIRTTTSGSSLGKITIARPSSGMFLFDTAGHDVFYGQSVLIVRDGNTIGHAVVNRRFTAQRAAAARIESTIKEIRVGDEIRG